MAIGPLMGRRLWLWAVYFAVMIVVISIDYVGKAYEKNCETPSWTVKIWHQRLCLAGHRKPRAHYVRVVGLTAGNEYSKDDHCGARRFVASLLVRLKELGPSLIVIDKYYKPSGGCQDPVVNAKLQLAVNQVSTTVPIVVGRSSDKYEELRDNNDPDLDLWRKWNLGQGEDVEALSESDINADGSNSQLGLVRLACNNWEIPMRWRLYPTLRSLNASAKRQIEIDTLAFTAAKKVDIDLADVVRQHVERGDRLVSAFLPIESFHPLTGTQVLCGLQATKYDPARCISEPPEVLSLRGKIVVIGEYSRRDTHQTVIGKMPGFLLQANYIESLLDDRYYQQIPKWLEIALTLLCFLILDITIERARNVHVGALWSLGIIVVLWLVSHFSIMQWGYYFVFWFPMAIALPAKWLEASIKVPGKIESESATAGG